MILLILQQGVNDYYLGLKLIPTQSFHKTKGNIFLFNVNNQG